MIHEDGGETCAMLNGDNFEDDEVEVHRCAPSARDSANPGKGAVVVLQACNEGPSRSAFLGGAVSVDVQAASRVKLAAAARLDGQS